MLDSITNLERTDRNFALILRAFEGDQINSVPNKRTEKNDNIYSPSRDSVITGFSDAINSFALPVALDLSESLQMEAGFYPGSSYEMDTKTTYINVNDEQWFDAFKLLATASYFILIIPSDSKSLLLEIEFIINNNLESKVLVYMPPSDQDQYKYVKTVWDRCCKYLSKANLNFPAYQKKGLLYVPNKDFSVASKNTNSLSIPITNFDKRNLLNCFNYHLQLNMLQKGRPISEVYPKLSATIDLETFMPYELY